MDMAPLQTTLLLPVRGTTTGTITPEDKAMVAPAPSPPVAHVVPKSKEEFGETNLSDTESSTGEKYVSSKNIVEHDPRDMTKTPPIIASKTRGKRGKRSLKKPADMPRRPLSGYNYFFSEEKNTILEEQSKMPKDETRDIFTTLGRIVANRWKKLDQDGKKKYNDLAAKDLIRYRKEMDQYNGKIAMRNRKEATSNSAKSGGTADLKPAALTASHGVSSFSAVHAPGQPKPLMQTPLAQYPAALQAHQMHPSLLGTTQTTTLTGDLSQFQRPGGLDLDRLALARHEALTVQLDSMRGKQLIQQLLGRSPTIPMGGSSQSQLLQLAYPAGMRQQAALQFPNYTQSVNGVMGGGNIADPVATFGLGGTAQSNPLPAGAEETSISIRQQILQQHQRLQEESFQQAYLRLLQRQHAEQEEVLRQIAGRGIPPGGSPPM